MHGFLVSLAVSICVCGYMSVVFHVYDKYKSTFLPMVMVSIPATVAISQLISLYGRAG